MPQKASLTKRALHTGIIQLPTPQTRTKSEEQVILVFFRWPVAFFPFVNNSLGQSKIKNPPSAFWREVTSSGNKQYINQIASVIRQHLERLFFISLFGNTATQNGTWPYLIL